MSITTVKMMPTASVMRTTTVRSTLTRSGFKSVVARTASTSAVPVATAASVISIATNLKNSADVEDLVLTYGVPNAHIPSKVRPLAVVKVGGEVIAKDIDNLVASLRFMRDFGLLPVVIHGGGPQLNDELAKAGVEPQYIGGHRVTDAPTMAVARKVFEGANHTLAAALRKAGLPCEQFLGGVFNAQVAKAELGLVGEIKSVSGAGVNEAIAAGKIPVLTSLGVNMGDTSVSPVLNINADVAARELAITLQPLKVVFISAGGGWKEEGKVVAEVDMANDFARMEARDYTGRQGTLLKLREMKQIIDKLPAVSSVTIASASALAAQLLPHRGPGTQIRKGVKLHKYNNLGSVDRGALEGLLRACGKSGEAGLKVLQAHPAGAPAAAAGEDGVPHVAGVIATESFSAAAIVLAPASAGALPTVACMALSPIATAEGVETALWKELKESYPNGLIWTALPAPDIASATAEVQAKGPSSIPTAFPALSVSRTSPQATQIVKASDGSAAMVWKPTGAAAAVSAAGATVTANTASAAAASGKTKNIRVGLLGARGFVGRELLKLLAGHPEMVVTAAGSRALAGKDVATALEVPEAAAAVAPGTTFSDIGIEQLKRGEHAPVDAWVLALPNGLCAPHAAAIEAASASSGKPLPLMIDLSADMRFDTTGQWTYGLPERPGARAAISKARKISNPGCYATGAQAALLPLLPQHAGQDCRGGSTAAAPFAWNPSFKPHVFGVSGYSGAGTTPSDKNDPNRLRDNLLAYSLTGHIHEREVGWHCGLLPNGGIAFMPHVAPFFQGIHLTVTGHISGVNGQALDLASVTPAALAERYQAFYAGEKLMSVAGMGKDGKPIMPDVASHGSYKHGVTVGGFTYDAKTGRVALVSCIDNLLKGAATQALQNMNLALGLPEYSGIPMQ